jgi:hypothetical protein
MRFGIGDAFIEQPGAHLVVALEPQPGREEAVENQVENQVGLVCDPSPSPIPACTPVT